MRPMAFFYEIGTDDDSVLKRTVVSPDREAATIAARADAKKIKNSAQPGRAGIGQILVGQNTEKSTRY